MSRLRELRVHGFKTFADPTRFTFERGITAVIGPNGSGKSNMADAIRWVLGEQSNRSLRMRRAEDVIFAGSQQRRAQGMAEAIVTLDNTDRWLPIDFAEVSIGRRVYRSGESEYLLNGARVRLRDISELLGEGRLGATDLVVVGQGTVDSALSLRPEERRQLFEEAAGVKALQVRKNEALARLAGARDNLVRVRDLVAELRPQVRRLALQAEHQERHDELATSLATLTQESQRRREAEVRDLVGDAARRAAATEAELAGFESAHANLEEATREARAELSAAESAAASAAGEREVARDAVIRTEAELDSLRTRERELEEAIAASEKAERAASDRVAAITERTRDAADGSSTQGTASSAGSEAAAAAEAEWRAAVDGLRAADDALIAVEDRLAAARRQRAVSDAARLAHAAAVEAATARQARAQAERDTTAASLPQLAEAVVSAEEAAARAASEARVAREREDAAHEAAEQAARALSERRARVAQMRAEIEGLRRRAGSPGGSRTSEDSSVPLLERLRSAGWEAIESAVRVGAGQRRAVEAAIGEGLASTLSWDGAAPTPDLSGSTGAVRIVVFDDGAGEGREPEGRERALRAVGATQTLADWLDGARHPALFRCTVVAPDLAALLSGWRDLPAGWAAITRDGDLADHRGVLVLRGRGQRAGSTTSPEADAALLDGLIADERAEALALAAEERTSTQAARAGQEAADGRRKAERRAEDAAVAVGAARRRHERAARALADLDRELATTAAALAGTVARQAEPAESGAGLGALEEEARSLTVERETAARRRDEARAAWDAARELADRAVRDHRAVVEELARAEAERAAAAAARPLQAERFAAVRAQISVATDRLSTLVQLAVAANEGRDQAARAREAARGRLAEVERQSAGASAQRAQLQAAVERAVLDLARHEEALSELRREREMELEGLPAGGTDAAQEIAGTPQVHADLNEVELDAELRRVRRALSQIGSVNPFAVAEHAELAGRLGDLTTQEGDLEGALASTGALVRQLETEIAERFGAAFEAIGAAFDEFARILFAGGSASVRMTGEEDGGSPAIEIAVRPPGKRLQPLSSLSGGERALAGVALLFAMLTVHPVPFCVLDEVDAALDEANVGRFAEALRRLSSTTDFVVVTHNRATIEMADTIYGVTMTDAAVSRVLSLRLSDVPLEATG